MRMVLVFLLLLLAPVASAQTLTVKSGEHDGFSRLVLPFPRPADWLLSRTEDGYILDPRQPNLRFDLSEVYRRIPRNRLSSIGFDPQTGVLRLGVTCRCHAIPFELQPRLLVIDILDGPPPEASSFEISKDGKKLPALRESAGSRPRTRPAAKTEARTEKAAYDWRSLTVGGSETAEVNNRLQWPQVATNDVATSEMRDSLLWQLSRGAAQGIIEMAVPARPQLRKPPPLMQLEQVRIGGKAGMKVDTQRAAPDRLTREGLECLPDNRLDIASWGIEGEVANQIGPVRNGLVGEFDLPDPVVVRKAVIYYLYLGFGAEARQLLRALDVATPDYAIWQTMAHVLDGDDITRSAFAEMEVCDTAAALWSALSAPEHITGTDPRIEAVLRTFSGLPLHLRRHLGPMLAARFLARDDTETARAIRDAILRAPGDHGPSVRLMAAGIDLAQGGDETAIIPLMAEPGQTGAEATVAMVRATVARGSMIDAGITTALESLILENRGGALEQPLQQALSLALASQDRYGEAFALAGLNTPVTPQIWDMLAQTGTNSALLQHAIVDPETPLPDVSAETDRLFASRLIGLGFSMPALRWLAPSRRKPAILSESDRLLTATAEISRRNGRAALRALAGIETDAALSLRAQAQEQLGDRAAISSFAKIGSTPEQMRAAREERDWATIATLRPQDAWGAAAALVADTAPAAAATGPEPVPDGPLAKGRQTVAESAASRAILETLLNGVRKDVSARP